MPPLPPADRAIRIRFAGVHQTTVWNNVLYVQYTAGVPGAADLATLASDLATLYDTQLQQWLGTIIELKQVEAIDVSSGSGNAGIWTGTLAGAVGGGVTPANVAVCISKKVARRYRGGHPRIYLGGIPTSSLADAKSFTPTFRNNMEVAAVAFRTAINAKTYATTGQITLANVSYYQGKGSDGKPLLRGVPLVEPIVGMAVNTRIDSMRRRLGA